MKKVLSVLAVAALFLVAITGCNPQEKTYADYLTQQTKGWVLSAATSSPDYKMLDGSFVTDIYQDYLYEWEQQYIYIFNQNGNELVKPGKTPAPSAEDGIIAETSMGNWEIKLDENVNGRTMDVLYMYLPFIQNQDGTITKDAFQILSITDQMMQVKYYINDDDVTAKGNYEWILTFIPAK